MPCDSHVHSEWSWDTAVGDMEGSCARAVEIGLPAIAFTEHLDYTVWRIALEGSVRHGPSHRYRRPGRAADTPAFEPVGYLEAIEHCRDRFPQPHILSGLETGEPHQDAYEVMREYPAGVAAMMSTSGMFSVLAHIDYPVRSWPADRVGPFDPGRFEEEFRHALRATAQSGRALEISTRPLRNIGTKLALAMMMSRAERQSKKP